ncbi:SUMF1/EgtB/PvdO family nonheme iron enzyme [Pseudanabaena sp. FACHB-1998]|uniref:nSTAND1 domain-containing NTPase n=1 Tax=Pseudanabaena sp. FACHB-1998 TaxID=2692858 RepID=UPI001680B0CB|nr:SUMF1/EgtB/PvdO family nonheme iron enzyme [Pseudanabaena sp. FACHB-1998]MBD2176005.1 SUMF1/EgtB/PvdO family nonheme iron enzyme [Pseudanabaena sp. FACHB-1998]
MAKVALVIGVARYGNFNNLEKTANDAGAIAEIFEQDGNYVIEPLPRKLDANNESRYEFDADPKKEVKYKDLLAKIKHFLGEQAKGKDALIYFAGHGFVAKNDADDDIGFFAATDSSKDGQNSLSFDIFTTLVAKSELKSLVVLLDCCNAGNLLERSQYQGMQKVFNEKNYYLMAACQGSERAREGKEHGIFTAGILNVLQAKIKEGERIDLDLLFSEVSKQLQQSGQEVIRTAGGGAIILIEKARGNVAPVVDETCPYVGLNAFDQNTAKYFCGRDSQIDLLLRKIEASRFVPVIGASGSGKSSLVRAGLMPALKEQGWCVLPPIKPWFNPLMLLKQALVEQFYKLPTEIKKAYAKLESEGLNAILPERSPRVLLVVDQFEELFTVCTNEQERQEFIRLLAEGADHEGRLTIATTMRADFVEQALQYPALAKLIQRDRAFWLVPLEPSELRDAIAEPARMQGCELAEGLLEVICQDVEAEKNSLPLLEFALTELWEKRDRQKHRLTLTAYAEMGKLRGALDRHAKQLYEGLSSDLERNWTRRLFLQLVRTGQDVRDTRQRQAKQFLLEMARSEEDREAIANLLEVFAGAEGRLLTMGEENNVAFMDLAHEALIDGWQMFKEWRSQDRDLRRLCDLVKDNFQGFNNAKEEDKDKFLLSEGVIAQIEEKGTAINDYPLPEEFVQRSRYKYKPWLDPANFPEMVDIPSGTFWMGSPEGKGDDDEKPYHQVTVKAFQMGKYLVTQAQWRTVAMSPKVAIDLILNPSYYRGEDCPVEKVNWYEAQEFCARLSSLTGESYRLPSEAEWEYACRAGLEEYMEYCFGGDADQLGEYAWYDKNSERKTHPVGQKLPNAWGLYDLHGNVWEWCADDWYDSYEGTPIGSQNWIKDIKNYKEGDGTTKSQRGGSWFSNAYNCRSANRNRSFTDHRDYYLGFRVIL